MQKKKQMRKLIINCFRLPRNANSITFSIHLVYDNNYHDNLNFIQIIIQDKNEKLAITFILWLTKTISLNVHIYQSYILYIYSQRQNRSFFFPIGLKNLILWWWLEIKNGKKFYSTFWIFDIVSIRSIWNQSYRSISSKWNIYHVFEHADYHRKNKHK